MPNIFDGLRKIPDKDIIEQIALLETMNITNISKPIIQKAKKKTINVINFIRSKLGKEDAIEEPEVVEIWALIDERKSELKNCTREELNEKLFDILTEKSKCEEKNPTEDVISIEIIDETSRLYKLYKNLTPCQKADNIYLKYNEKISGKAKEYLNEQSFIDLQETTDDIEEIITNMDENQKKEFTQSVDVEKVTLLNVWKKLDRQHFARLIWLSVKAYGGRFTPKEEILPSYVENDEEIEVTRKEEELKKSQKELLELKKNIELCKDKITSIENNLQKENRLLNNAIKSKKQAEEDIVELEEMGVKIVELKKSQEDKLQEIKEQIEKAVLVEEVDSLMEEYKKVKFDTIDINNKISDVNIEGTYKRELIEDNIKLIASKEEIIKKIDGEFQQLKTDADNLIGIYNEKKEDVHNKEEQKRNETFERWSKFFTKFTFEFDDLSNIVNFSRKELLHIEECLYELHFSKDPVAMSMGLIESKISRKEKEEYQYMDVVFPDKFQVEIQYKVFGTEEKNIHIAEITTEF